jgi:NhaP-type Na+/H+ or K+/H+ antiporter
MPFSALGITFLLLGLILDDSQQLYFGLVWIIIAAIAVIIRNSKMRKNDKA